MDPAEVFFKQIDDERDIYELAELHHQKRKKVGDVLGKLASIEQTNGDLKLEGDNLVCEATGKKYPVKNDVVSFITTEGTGHEEWERLNKQFLNYHRSLSVYTLVNAAPIINYVSIKSKIGLTKDATVVDIGGGTGHTFCSFFRYPETLDYILIDPNLRLLHDQFLRVYPQLNELPLTHLLAYAENLPIKSETADVVMSISAIDHMKDYKQFIKEAFRILKPGGKFLLSSHLDIDDYPVPRKKVAPLSYGFFEKAARYLYYRKYRVGKDDHTFHFPDTTPMIEAMKEAGFSIEDEETFKRYFYIVGKK